MVPLSGRAQPWLSGNGLVSDVDGEVQAPRAAGMQSKEVALIENCESSRSVQHQSTAAAILRAGEENLRVVTSLYEHPMHYGVRSVPLGD